MGIMKDLNDRIQGLLDQWVETGAERGVQAAVYYRGALVVDAFAGTAIPATGIVVTGDTLFPIFSTGKGLVATVIHRLVEQGVFDYETPISQFWPEFGQNGKEGVTVRHALTHTSGLAHVPVGARFAEIDDWDYICSLMAAQAPSSVPGSRPEYHAITFGWILGELAHRATGFDFPDLLEREIKAPLGINNLFTGVPPELEPTVATLEDTWSSDAPPAGDAPPAEEKPEAIPQWIFPLTAWMNQADARLACIPASNGVGSARAVARHYASLLPGGLNGVELLPAARVAAALVPQNPPTEGVPNFGLGYAVGDSGFGHGGYGGSQGLGHVVEGWAFGFTRNRFSDQNSSQMVLDVVREGLGLRGS